MAFREALAGRPGPVFLECPMDVLNGFVQAAEASIPDEGYRTAGKPQGDPKLLDAAARLLKKSERPVIFAGTTVWWDDAAEPLRELAEKLQAPVFLNGGGRGSLPPDHPLFCSLARKVALGGADLILLVGTKLDFRLNYGEPPLIPREAKIVWLDTLQTRYRRQSRRGCRRGGRCGADRCARWRRVWARADSMTPGWRRCARRRRRRARLRRR